MVTVVRAYTANDKSNTEDQMDKSLGSMGEFHVRGFIGKSKVQVTTVFCTRRETERRTRGYMFTLNQHESFFTQPKSGARVMMSREGNRDTLKVVCMLKPLMLKRELQKARQELRNLKADQHENKRRKRGQER